MLAPNFYCIFHHIILQKKGAVLLVDAREQVGKVVGAAGGIV